jgi:N-acetylglucosamine malate deacetylase 2
MLAETYYGVSLAPTNEGRAHLAQIRKQEALNAGKVLGIRRHYFLDQRDFGFTTDASAAGTENWDRPYVRSFLADLLSREKYDAVFTLLPTVETHGHHRAATLLALEAVAHMEGVRPLIFGGDARASQGHQLSFSGLHGEPLTRVASQAPALAFDRNTSFGYRDALNYQIAVNWLIAEHKSQGLFQTDFSQDRFEEFWVFQISGADAGERVSAFRRLFGKAAC